MHSPIQTKSFDLYDISYSTFKCVLIRLSRWSLRRSAQSTIPVKPMSCSHNELICKFKIWAVDFAPNSHGISLVQANTVNDGSQQHGVVQARRACECPRCGSSQSNCRAEMIAYRSRPRSLCDNPLISTQFHQTQYQQRESNFYIT